MSSATLVLSGSDHFLPLHVLSTTRRASCDCTVVVRVTTDPDLEASLGPLLAHPPTHQTNTLVVSGTNRDPAVSTLLGDLCGAGVHAEGVLDLILGEGELTL